jgi:hypothetical protein
LQWRVSAEGRATNRRLIKNRHQLSIALRAARTCAIESSRNATAGDSFL